MVEVLQIDREAAADLMEVIADVDGQPAFYGALRRGEEDGHYAVLSFAAARIAATQSATQEIERLKAALRQAEGALRNYACHGGEGVPCMRSDWQCEDECGKPAGDALIVVLAALQEPKP